MTIPGITDPAVPYGSLVIVSGVTGFIGSHVADQALAAGYRVRGTTRSRSKGSWAEEHFQEKYGLDMFELVEVPDMGAKGAFDNVVEGASGFFHVANDMTGSTDPGVAIPKAVNGVLNALQASDKEPSMRRFVYTSSSFAATQPKPDQKFTTTASSYNEEALQRAWLPGADGETVYSASKAEAERAVFQWVQEHNSRLTVNAILPNCNIGLVINPGCQGYPTSARWVKALWDMDYASLANTPPQHYINVQDDARLHIIALAHQSVQNERIFAVAGPVSLNDIIHALRRLFPQKTWDDFPDNRRDVSTFDAMPRAEQLLVDAYDKKFRSLEESVQDNSIGLL